MIEGSSALRRESLSSRGLPILWSFCSPCSASGRRGRGYHQGPGAQRGRLPCESVGGTFHGLVALLLARHSAVALYGDVAIAANKGVLMSVVPGTFASGIGAVLIGATDAVIGGVAITAGEGLHGVKRLHGVWPLPRARAYPGEGRYAK